VKTSTKKYALCIGAAMTVFTGCANTQSPMSATPTLLRSAPFTERSGDLLYAAGGRFGYVLTYPDGKRIGKFLLRIGNRPASANGLCADSKGNVFVTATSGSGSNIFEYAHGNAYPFTSLNVPYGPPIGCASDSGGNLAVTASYPNGRFLHVIEIYSGAQGKPVMYSDIRGISAVAYCTYDTSGDLFVDGVDAESHFQLVELAKNWKRFHPIAVDGIETKHPGNLQWVDGHLLVAIPHARKVYTVNVDGLRGKVVATTAIDDWDAPSTPQSWLRGSAFVAPFGSDGKSIALWHYPEGGKPFGVLRDFAAQASLSGVVVSASQ
jgi:hypothetical protein